MKRLQILRSALIVLLGLFFFTSSHAQIPCKTRFIPVEGGAVPETICNVKNLMRLPPSAPGIYILSHGVNKVEVKQTHLNNLVLAFDRISSVSNVTATLQVDLDDGINAYANSADRSVTFTNGLLLRGGVDVDLIAAVVGHELAHLKLRHTFSRNLIAVDSFKGNILWRNRSATDRASRIEDVIRHVGSMRSFSRAQELEADKLGTEWISEAKFDPKGILRFLNLASKNGQEAQADYMSTHPGGVERLQSAGLVVTNQQFDMQATEYFLRGDWRELSKIVGAWQRVLPGSARAYYFQGVIAKKYKRKNALSAFRESVANDPDFMPARLALCIELYQVGEYRESLLCAEHIPRGELFDRYEQSTFGYPVHVGGFIPQRYISAQDVAIARALCAAGLCR